MYFLLFYLASFFGLFSCIFHYIKYLERSHTREKCRQFGNYINNKINSETYMFICENMLQQILILCDALNGLLEGIIGLEPMVELYRPSENENNNNIIEEKPIIKEVFIDNIIEKIIEVPIYNDKYIIEEVKKLLNPITPLLCYDTENKNLAYNSTEKNNHILSNEGGTVINLQNINKDKTLYEKIENIFNNDPIPEYKNSEVNNFTDTDTLFIEHSDNNNTFNKFSDYPLGNSIFIKKNKNKINNNENINTSIRSSTNIESIIDNSKRKIKISLKKNK